MERGEAVNFPLMLNKKNNKKENPINIGAQGIVSDLCGIPLAGTLNVNNAAFMPSQNYHLENKDFLGVIHDQEDIIPKLNVSVYNVRLGNGQKLDSDKYDNACALTSVIELANKDDN